MDYRNQIHFTNFLNHSDTPNVRFENGSYFTSKKIPKGEETLISMAENNYNPDGLHFKDLSKTDDE